MSKINTGKQYRLVTRSDLDGLVSATLLKKLNLINDIKFVHPKDVQDGTVEITENDITTNLPYNEKAYLCFDHHHSEIERLGGEMPESYILDANAPSAAQVVFEYYGGAETFHDIIPDMMAGVNQADSAQFNKDEVLNPTGWVLLSFLTDPRTGLGRFREFRISNYNLMMELIDICLHAKTIEEVLANPDVQERVVLYNEYAQRAKDQLLSCGKMHGKIVVFDPRNEENIYPTNRFMIYALYPEATISIHAMWGLKQQNTVLAIGKSIFDRSSKADIGSLMLKYNGGGHKAAGTCQVENDEADTKLKEIVDALNAAN